ncbi:copper-exporting P-type ATPase A [Oxobacter pfennigii]|uniref:Copper-exporting P-type ATPase A n=1 Tax=Oxobacter pfennigii TaxID=36849 RepID=A0A0P8YE44_9CLOT|nr:sulfite exporter TauE/SafE family protein [Oxobacter pfennigii]KPU45492.1 copper-exporting P-type ATPase A [Oxobacter pfennigii]
MSMKKEVIKVYNMTCTSCENRVENAIKKLDGVVSVKANYADEEAWVEYDADLCDINLIKNAIQKAGYSTKDSAIDKIFGVLIIAAAVIILSQYTGRFDMSSKLNENTTFFILFVVGLLTSIHCVGMCGGIMLSQTLSSSDTAFINGSKFQALKPALLYNTGRVISYTILGMVVGAIGSVLSVSPAVKAGIMIFAGVFMIIMGFNMYGFSWFRKISIKLPLTSFSFKNKANTPFIVGLLNGFMPCGPLQTMQLYALGSGSFIKGGLSMFIFALGTVPLMLFFGAVAGFLSKEYSKRILKFSGILIIVLGFIMSNRGLALAGVNINPLQIIQSQDQNSNTPASKAELKDGIQVVKTAATYYGYEPAVIYVQKGIPVKWTVEGQQITSCNNAIIIPSLRIQKEIKKGENIIEFTPGDNDINYSCWMGMIRGVIRVVDDLEAVDIKNADSSIDSSSNIQSQPAPSIYGDDISQIKSERLVKKALVSGNNQTVDIKGIGYEFDPLILVVNKDIPVKISVDLSQFDNYVGSFKIISGSTGDTVTSFTGIKSLTSFEYNFSESGIYGIFKDNGIQALIMVVDDLENTDIEEIRTEFIR